MTQYGIFGGSFSPPHIGHLLTATYAVAMYNLDRLYIVPSVRHPWKPETAPFNARLCMLRETFKQTPFRVDADAELLLAEQNPEQPVYTYDVVRWYKRRYPKDTWFLVIGADELATITSWYRYEDLMREVRLIISILWTTHHSSEIRSMLRQIAAGNLVGPADGLGLTPLVREYIQQHGLYREEET